uniref:Histidine--tRNA ligase, cytoplasmic n=1 Tax=Kalanchoe fedtschenkoi TaxID=63787 RepID=A0A7N0ZZC4_KALFE
MANRVVTIGGKGSALAASAVYDVAHGLSQVRIDSSALDKLSSSKLTPQSSTTRFSILPDDLSREELRAALLVSLSKLIASGASGVSPGLLNQIAHLLNENSDKSGFDLLDVSEGEFSILSNCAAALHGICAILDHLASSFSVVADFAAALACEALKADVSPFNAVDSGDGFSLKEEVAVASDLKILLNGSKFTGKLLDVSVSEIPRLHGSLREVVKSIHTRTRIELNSGIKVGSGKAAATAVIPLANALKFLGENSLSRADLILNALADSCNLRGRFEENATNFKKFVNLISKSSFESDHLMFVHHVLGFMKIVWDIITWETVLAFTSLEENSAGKSLINEVNSSNDKKREKKNKMVLGKGNAAIVQHIKEMLQSEQIDLVEELCAILDPKHPGFDALLKKIKETVESNESRRLPKLPKGTRDFAKEQMAIREKAFGIITDVFKRHGATALDTPVFELRETLMGKYGEDSKLIYDLADQGGELCSLRYDLTVPFARYVAMNGLTSFKRYQISKVYRRDNPSKGRYREFYQCDLDIAGQYELMGPDFEIVKILTELLDELDIGEYEVKLNHRKLLDGMMEICGVPPQKFRTICSSIDKLDKQTFEQIKKEMVEEKGLTAETADKIGVYVKQRGSPLELLYKLKQDGSMLLENQGSLVALNELQILFKALEKSKCIDKVSFDLSLARGLDYYTGVIFEAVFKGSMQVGSIAAGGRYDNLIGMFGTKQVPAVGVSLGIERVFAIMEEAQKDRNQIIRATETQVLVSVLGDDLIQAAELVSELWSAKIKAEFMVNKRMNKHFERTRDSRIPWWVIVGEKEMRDGTVNIKNTGTSEEFPGIPREQFVEKLQQLMSG